jgi:hypothetical protein
VLLAPALALRIGRVGFTPAVLSPVALMLVVLVPLVLALLERGPRRWA